MPPPESPSLPPIKEWMAARAQRERRARSRKARAKLAAVNDPPRFPRLLQRIRGAIEAFIRPSRRRADRPARGQTAPFPGPSSSQETSA